MKNTIELIYNFNHIKYFFNIFVSWRDFIELFEEEIGLGNLDIILLSYYIEYEKD